VEKQGEIGAPDLQHLVQNVAQWCTFFQHHAYNALSMHDLVFGGGRFVAQARQMRKLWVKKRRRTGRYG
jgi:hypothetical protein